MRLIDADKLYPDTFGKGRLAVSQSQIADAPTVQAVPIPDNATNGDVLMAMFPNGKIWKSDNFMCLLIDGQGDAQMFDIDWWNAPYKGSDAE